MNAEYKTEINKNWTNYNWINWLTHRSIHFRSLIPLLCLTKWMSRTWLCQLLPWGSPFYCWIVDCSMNSKRIRGFHNRFLRRLPPWRWLTQSTCIPKKMNLQTYQHINLYSKEDESAKQNQKLKTIEKKNYLVRKFKRRNLSADWINRHVISPAFPSHCIDWI